MRGYHKASGNVAGSTLIDYLTGARDQMPKGSAPLSAEQIDLFRTWIREGATNDLDPNSGRTTSGSSIGTAPSTGTGAGKSARRRASALATTASPTLPSGVRLVGWHLVCQSLWKVTPATLASNDNAFRICACCTRTAPRYRNLDI